MENKNVTQSRGSNFATIPGLLILIFFLGLSFYFKANIISAFLLLFIILCFIALLWSKSASKHLTGTIEFLTPGVFPGDEIKLKLKVSNTGKLSTIWVDTYLPFPQKTLIQPINSALKYVEMTQPDWVGEALQQKFIWLKSNQELTCILKLKAVRRGILAVDRIYFQTGDGFGIGTLRHAELFSGKAVTAIYPKLYPVSLQSFLLHGTNMDAGKRGEYEDVTLLKNIRSYAYGDSFKHINWRMLAKQDSLQINMYERITPESITFLLDLKSFETTRHKEGGADHEMIRCTRDESLELAISLTASCILRLYEQGVPCGLLLPEYDDTPARICSENARSEQTQTILMMLAEIAYEGGDIHWPVDELNRLSTSSGQIYVIMYDTPDNSLLQSGIASRLKFICMKESSSFTNADIISASDILEGSFSQNI